MKTGLKIITLAILIAGNSFEGIAQQKNKSKQPAQHKVQQHSKHNTQHKTHHVARKTVVYKTPKRKVVAVRNIPGNKVMIQHKGVSVYYDNHKFYRLNGGSYFPVLPGVGLRVNSLPIGYRTVIINNRNFYSYDGVYYTQNDNYYEVVQPEIGTVVFELPEGTEKVTVDGMQLYEYNDVLYEKIQQNGTRAYEIVGVIE
ncbi:DUF6515 family protein [Crocinitomix catalasitica]|uniref:DUF6515 family protein n=1 Tax=Crocinitomix catalasitica TaxID=184607 RepID=UPI00048481BB|nr:DUF6515 family protein [Crocinitomix catalasitica]